MTRRLEERIIPVPRSVIFDLVADVEKYPKFLPMWKQVRVRARDASGYETEQLVGFGPIRERFATRTVLFPPDSIEITSHDALFQRFLIRWRFHELRDDLSRVSIELDWTVRRRILQKAINAVMPETARSMILAFEARALKGQNDSR